MALVIAAHADKPPVMQPEVEKLEGADAEAQSAHEQVHRASPAVDEVVVSMQLSLAQCEAAVATKTQAGTCLSSYGAVARGVREWAKQGVEQEEYLNVVANLEQVVAQRTELACEWVGVSQLLRDYNAQCAALFERVLMRSRSSVDKWNPENFKHDLNLMDEMRTSMMDRHKKLKDLSQAQTLTKNLLHLDRCIKTQNTSALKEAAIKNYEEMVEKQFEMQLKRGEKEVERQGFKIAMESLQKRLADEAAQEKLLKLQLEQVQKRKEYLQDGKNRDADDHLAHLTKLREELTKQMEEQSKQRYKRKKEMLQKVTELEVALGAVRESVPMFQKLANWALGGQGEEERIKAKIALLREMEMTELRTQRELDEVEHAAFVQKTSGLLDLDRALTRWYTEGASQETITDAWEKELPELEAQVKKLQEELKECVERQKEAQKSLAEQTQKCEAYSTLLDGSQESFEQAMQSFQQGQKSQTREMLDLVEKGETMGHESLAVQRLAEIQNLIALQSNYQIYLSQLLAWMESFLRFTHNFTNKLRQPLPELSVSSMADFIFGQLLRERGLHLQAGEEKPSSAKNLRLFLEHEVQSMGLGDEEEILKHFQQAGIDAEELCQHCGVKEDDEQPPAILQQNVEKKLDEAVLVVAGIPGTGLSTKARRDKQSTLNDLRKELGRHRLSLGKVLDEDSREEVETLIEETEGKIEKVEEELEDDDELKREGEKAKAEARGSYQLLRSTMKQCRLVYERQSAKERYNEVLSIFGMLHRTVLKNITNFSDLVAEGPDAIKDVSGRLH